MRPVGAPRVAVRGNGSRRRRLRTLHRWTGLLAGLFLFLLALTGALINHANDLGLDRRPVTIAAVHAWYGLPEPPPARAVSLERLTVYGAGDVVLVNDRRHALGPITGAVEHGDLVLVASAEQLLLLTPGGEPVERMAPPGDGSIEALGRSDDGRTLMRTPTGLLEADEDLLNWTPVSDVPTVSWHIPEVLPDDAARPEKLGQPALTWEQVLLDLHAGRLFGITGTVINDLAAVAIAYLFISGLITWRRNGGGRRPPSKA